MNRLSKVDLVVTRHTALVAYLRELGLVKETTRVAAHVSIEDVRGKVTAGVLPMHLAAAAHRHIEIPLDMPPEARGRAR